MCIVYAALPVYIKNKAEMPISNKTQLNTSVPVYMLSQNVGVLSAVKMTMMTMIDDVAWVGGQVPVHC